MKKGFDIYEYVHKNNFTLKVKPSKYATKVAKGYNDIRKTTVNEAKIVDGKFSLKESLAGDLPKLSTEVKRHFLEIISTYKTFESQMRRNSDIIEVAETLGGVIEAAKHLTLNEADDWFDKVTIKRNMKELERLDQSFDKVATEARALDERLHALYEDMGHILSRYYTIAELDEEVMQQRLGLKTKRK